MAGSGRHKNGWKGCCVMCAANKGKISVAGQGFRKPVSELRKIGRTKRVKRNELWE